MEVLKSRSIRSRLLALAVSASVLAIVAGTTGFSTGSVSRAAPQAAVRQAPKVTFAYPTQRAIAEWDEFAGQFRAIESVEVRARVSGYLETIAFEDGQIVNAGDLLFRIDPRPYQAELAVAEGELAGARSALQQARSEQERFRRLLQRQAVSQEEAERRDNARLQAEASVASATARVEQARLNLEFTEVRAPVGGRISDNFISKGNLIVGGAQGGTVLSAIVSLDPIYFEFTTSEADYLKYAREDKANTQHGLRGTLHPVYGKLQDEQEFRREGLLSFVDNRLDRSTGTMRGRVTFDNTDGILAPGMFGRIKLQHGAGTPALLVPDEAIQTDQDTKFVWVIGANDVASRRPLELGPVVDGLRVVRGGLAADDRVIVGGTQSVVANAPVAAQPAFDKRFDIAARS
jgi:RND family efflux transporter MFP subunit